MEPVALVVGVWRGYLLHGPCSFRSWQPADGGPPARPPARAAKKRPNGYAGAVVTIEPRAALSSSTMTLSPVTVTS